MARAPIKPVSDVRTEVSISTIDISLFGAGAVQVREFS
jgi:hypothetical protein